MDPFSLIWIQNGGLESYLLPLINQILAISFIESSLPFDKNQILPILERASLKKSYPLLSLCFRLILSKHTVGLKLFSHDALYFD